MFTFRQKNPSANPAGAQLPPEISGHRFVQVLSDFFTEQAQRPDSKQPINEEPDPWHPHAWRRLVILLPEANTIRPGNLTLQRLKQRSSSSIPWQ